MRNFIVGVMFASVVGGVASLSFAKGRAADHAPYPFEYTVLTTSAVGIEKQLNGSAERGWEYVGNIELIGGTRGLILKRSK